MSDVVRTIGKVANTPGNLGKIAILGGLGVVAIVAYELLKGTNTSGQSAASTSSSTNPAQSSSPSTGGPASTTVSPSNTPNYSQTVNPSNIPTNNTGGGGQSAGYTGGSVYNINYSPSSNSAYTSTFSPNTPISIQNTSTSSSVTNNSKTTNTQNTSSVNTTNSKTINNTASGIGSNLVNGKYQSGGSSKGILSWLP